MKGIIFNEPMVKAWLAGNKTVTRRLIKKANHPIDGPAGAVHPAKIDGFIAWWPGNVDPEFTKKAYNHGFLPPYLPGETVYIKETWTTRDPIYDDDKQVSFSNQVIVDPSILIYKASVDEFTMRKIRWRSPRFMPEWASRSHALIVSIRAEKVQEITEEEARREGCGFSGPGSSTACWNFQQVWESLHPGSWERNDFVFRYELKRVLK